MPLDVGSHVGRIRIDALLGAGGMGEYYRGWDEKLERAVARIRSARRSAARSSAHVCSTRAAGTAKLPQ
jgi:hypothetical protein